MSLGVQGTRVVVVICTSSHEFFKAAVFRFPVKRFSSLTIGHDLALVAALLSCELNRSRKLAGCLARFCHFLHDITSNVSGLNSNTYDV